MRIKNLDVLKKLSYPKEQNMITSKLKQQALRKLNLNRHRFSSFSGSFSLKLIWIETSQIILTQKHVNKECSKDLVNRRLNGLKEKKVTSSPELIRNLKQSKINK